MATLKRRRGCYGVVYTKLAGEGGWQAKLLRESKATDLDIDTNRAFPP